MEDLGFGPGQFSDLCQWIVILCLMWANCHSQKTAKRRLQQKGSGIITGSQVTVIRPLPCGCTVDGCGSRKDPWCPVLCNTHRD